MPSCPVCQYPVAEGGEFCPKCGAAQVAPAAAIQTGPADPTSPLRSPTPGVVLGSLSDAVLVLKAAPGLLFAQFFTFIAFSFFTGVGFGLSGDGGLTAQLGSQGASFIGVLVAAGFSLTTLKLMRGQSTGYGDLFQGFPLIIPIFLTYLLTLILVILGLLLLIIPGLILALGFAFWQYRILDGERKVTEALGQSWRMMRGYKLKLLWLGLLLIPINLGGLLCLLVGVFITIPLSMIAMTAFYERVRTENPAA